MKTRMRTQWVVATLPKSEAIFNQGFNGEPLEADFPEIQSVCRFIETVERPSVTFRLL